jgi:hypothetical protein
MSLFEFLMVLVSIIVGLGVAEILTGIARQIRSRTSSVGYWVHSCAVTLIFFALLQNWWELWGLRDVDEWVFSGLVLMLLTPAGLYLIAHLIFPDPIQGTEIKTYYYGAMRPVWWLAVLVAIASTLFRPLAFGADLIDLDNAAAVLMLVGFITLATSKSVVVHSVLVPAFLLLLLWDVLWWHPTVRLG